MLLCLNRVVALSLLQHGLRFACSIFIFSVPSNCQLRSAFKWKFDPPHPTGTTQQAFLNFSFLGGMTTKDETLTNQPLADQVETHLCMLEDMHDDNGGEQTQAVGHKA